MKIVIIVNIVKLQEVYEIQIGTLVKYLIIKDGVVSKLGNVNIGGRIE